SSMKDWMITNDYDAVVVNLDPGSEFVPYDPEIDIRETISLDQIMSEFNLGPNGAQIVASDLLLENLDSIEKTLKELDDYYVIFDTPGQIELFSFRQGSPIIVDRLGGDRAMLAFIADAVLSDSPSGFISQKMLYGSVLSRFYKPMLYVLNKIDLIPEDSLKRIKGWEQSPDLLYDAFLEEKHGMLMDYYAGLIKAFSEANLLGKIYPVSSRDLIGFEDIYSQMSLFFLGGSDTDTAYRDD
ncbi:MAG: ATP/GTP-binding protein, partial [Thermoplasmataceae archaeon]